MAPVVKWLRPRIVVPICMGSNPIRRPILKAPFSGVFLCNGADKTHQGKPLKEFEHEAAEGGGFTTKRRRVFLYNAGMVVAC